MNPTGTCFTCRKYRPGNWFVALLGYVFWSYGICLDRRCDPGLNTYWERKVAE